MRAALRCKEHYQGDRCKRAKAHAEDLDHQGSFQAWSGTGDSKRVTAVALGSHPRMRRTQRRKVDQILRVFTAKKTDVNLMPSAWRKTGSQLLGLALKIMGREAKS